MTHQHNKTEEMLLSELAELQKTHEQTRQELEKSLRSAENSLEICHGFADAGSEIHLLFDSRFKIVDINQAGIDFIKPDAQKEAFIGHSIEKIAPNAKKSGQYNEFLNVLTTGKPFVFEDDFLVSTHHKDPVQLSVKAFKLGNQLGIVASNITELKRVSQELGKTRALYKILTDLSPDPIVILQDEKYQFVNATFLRLFGYTQKDVDKGLSFLDLVHEHHRQAVIEQYNNRLKGKALSPAYRIEIVTKNGRIIPCETSASLIEYNGRPADLVIIRDISLQIAAEEERQRLETQLQHAQKLESLGVLAGGIAHDFNNLLTGILGNTDLALLEISDPSSAAKYIEGIEKAARQAANLTQQMLAYSGKGHFVIKTVDVSKLIKNTERLLKTSISKNVSLSLSLARNLPPVEADSSQIQQILMNLSTNASESFPYETEGTIIVSTGTKNCDRAFLTRCHGDDDLEEGPYVYVAVADNGSGMDSKTMTRIFDPFFSTKFTGRGLGLSAVLGIVRGHKGALHVESEEGKGTVFQVFFPSLQKQTEDGLNQGDASTEDKWKGAGTILLIDDEETVRTTGTLMLERMGFHVLTAIDGVEGMKLFQSSADDIQCVLLDLTMPRMGGRQTLKELRRVRPDVRVILSSGYDENEIVQRFQRRGLAGFIQKPYKYQSLRQKLKDALEKRDSKP